MTILTDIEKQPELFNEYIMAEIRERSAFLNSGALAATDALVPTEGFQINLPGFNGLSGEADVLDDSNPLVADKINSHNQVAPILERGKAWAAHDLITLRTGMDPLQAAAGQIGSFWARNYDAIGLDVAMAAADGIDSSGDVVNDISAETGAASNISAEAVIDTQNLAGEYAGEYDVIVMHPDVRAQLRKDDLTDFLPDSENVLQEMYQGMRIVVSSRLSPDVDTYSTLIVSVPALGLAENMDADLMFEFDRDAKAGRTDLVVRRRFVIHPFGTAYTGTLGGVSPANADLADSTNWELQAPDKLHFGVRVLKHTVGAS